MVLYSKKPKICNTLQEAERSTHWVKKYDNRKSHAVCESISKMWLQTHETLEKFVIGVKLADLRKTKAIASARKKNR